MIQHHPDPTQLSALDLLALARRGAAHDVNNLLAVIQGNTQLLPSLAADQLADACSEIELACERLAMLCDSWLLADFALPLSGRSARVEEAIGDVVRVIGATQEAELRIATDPAAVQLTCGFDDRTLRALLYCTLTSMLRSVHRAVVGIHWHARDANCTVHLHMACRVDHQPRIVAPDALGGSPAEWPASITTGLWDVAQCLRRHGGDLRHVHDCGAFHLWLDLPPLPV